MLMLSVSAEQWALIGNWVSGLGTALAAVVALYFSQVQRRDEIRDRLVSVSAWAELDVDSDEAADSASTWKLVVVNSTPQPIFRWRCEMTWADTETHREWVLWEDHGIIPPGREEFDWAPEPRPPGEAQVSTDIQFVDARGRQWSRRGDGTVHRVWRRAAWNRQEFGGEAR